jgi:pimeloyl-ACP methyl ester carboxylesterase
MKRTMIVAGALAASALLNHCLARRAERRHPASGRLIEVDGRLLHVKEYGAGEPLVILHGNGSAIEEVEASGLIALAARSRRVIVFDRPGHGHSPRPRGAIWTADAQAELVARALEQMGVPIATVFGHSWGALVAAALASRRPGLVEKLVLASGYYYPTPRIDVLLVSPGGLPVFGWIVSHAVTSVVARLFWPLLLRPIFSPMPVPRKFSRFPREMAVRPSQLYASAADTALMIPSAASLRRRYGKLTMPVVIIAGSKDKMVHTGSQSVRLHREIPGSRLMILAGAGHMIHQNCTGEVWAAIEAPA